MRVFKRLLAAAALLTMTATYSNADTVLIDSTLAGGNGDFLLTDAGQVGTVNSAPAATINVPRGRALIGQGAVTNDLFATEGTFASMVDGPGVSISGWTAYREVYNGGNNGLGFDGNFAYGLPTNDNNGQAFNNTTGGSIFLVSDSYAVAGGTIGDEFSFDFVAGSDDATAPNTPSFRTFLIFDDTTVAEVGSSIGISGVDPLANEVSRSFTTTAAYSDVRLAIGMFNDGASRSLVDNVGLSVAQVVPEPGSLALLGLAGLGLVTRRRR